jgi:hypothetical protein
VSEVRNTRRLGAPEVHRIDPLRSSTRHHADEQEITRDGGRDDEAADTETDPTSDGDDATIDEYV